MKTWRNVWRHGLAPQLSTAGLEALQHALLSDDGRLLQGATTSPPPLESIRDWEVEAACAVCFCAWQGDGWTTVDEVNSSFERICRRADQALREPAACRLFLTWFDQTPRADMRRQLLSEVSRVLNMRRDAAA